MSGEDRVLRTACEKIRACGKWYDCREASAIAFKIVSEHPLTRGNPGYHMPPIFYSGSPYGHIIANLGAKEIEPPEEYSVAYVPCHPHFQWWESKVWPDVFAEEQRDEIKQE